MKMTVPNLVHVHGKSFSSKLACLLLVAGLVGAAPVLAETPDGITPANEGVCDGLKTNATPGLYGLCVAYCEAQDLDIVGDKETPNNKILANYRKKMQAGDPDMPCFKVPCPCWSDAELAAITNRATAVPPDSISCASTTTTAQIRNTTNLQFATADTGRQPPLCRFTDTMVSPRISRRFEITAVEAQSCYDQVKAACTSIGK
ncbi:MAG: hypothetical protein NUV55_08820 [Sulfuricaulis sp.]|uniref:hypothetical protein n=1 Tax=Sulfuricaulis sp. TaxID=2003553 RepID=UPI0025E3E70A|nr:hypothetical protein [Sulfuricaulis sp.]MCR4347285.1 hypothetical protein [Sulfuricaulis sp.]